MSEVIPDYHSLEPRHFRPVGKNLFAICFTNVASKEAVGRWGECFVYNYLKHLKVLPNGVKITEVQWVNEETETGDPYDLTIVTETQEIWYVEVKATSSTNKELIPISWREIKFALVQKTVLYLI